jgi:transposase
LLNQFLKRLKIGAFLQEYVPATDKRQKLEPAVGLMLILRNILLARAPLYAIAEWAQRYDPALLDLPGSVRLDDDRLGRCLQALFRADRAGLMTKATVHAAEAFDLDLTEMHNDSTSVSFSGNYPQADGTPVQGRETHKITFGRNKDHRPDLKQLLFILTTTADGAVPIWAHVDHGNTSDDVTHIRTWETLCKLTGRTDFLYVADSKLCSVENLSHISRHGGRFVTVIPATWREHSQFHEWVLTDEVPWAELVRRPNARRKDDPPDVYRGYEHPIRTAQGYRVLWIWSSQKDAIDRATRERRVETALKDLQALSARIGTPRSRLKSADAVTAAAQKILEECRCAKWIKIEVSVTKVDRFAQAGPGRPGAETHFRRHKDEEITLSWHSDAQALKDETNTDGLFPLTTNDEKLSISQVLQAYKHQPALEKRFQQMKSVFNLRPMMLQNHARIEAFLFLYFLALMIEALVEREMRQRMRKQNIKAMPLYPEDRPNEAPTTQRLLELFADLRRHRLVDESGEIYQRFYDELSEPQRAVLRLFDISAKQYMSTAE